MTQLLLAMFSLLAVFLLTRGHGRALFWGSFFGLCSQPFWLYETFTAGQWGMFPLSVIYTLIYINSLIKWRQFWHRSTVD